MVEVKYTGGGGVQAHTVSPVNKSIGIDGSGNVWANNYSYSNVSKFSPLGVPLSPSTGFTLVHDELHSHRDLRRPLQN